MRQALAILLVAGCTTADLADTGDRAAVDDPVPGAVFTTLRLGAKAQLFADKSDVYLSEDIALPEGDYVFQVTDPSARSLLSTDAITCRVLHIDVGGRITAALGGACAHAWGNDLAQHGNMTLQLAPYADSAFGRYKVWVMPEQAYDQSGEFVPELSKTATFAVAPEDGSDSCGC